MKTFQSPKPKVNILIDPTKTGWRAKVHRADTGAVAYETPEYASQQFARDDARRWAANNRYLIGRILGMEGVSHRHEKNGAWSDATQPTGARYELLG